ncbi:MAG: hypothetical protein K6360_01890 [Deltaproteobacteria bacterium]
MVRLILTVFAIAAYAALFIVQDLDYTGRQAEIAIPLPARLQEAALGYLRQLGGEIAFIRASVFIGGVEPGRDPEGYAPALSETLRTAALLHPPFVDTYYYVESSLPHLSPHWAGVANDILAIGLDSVPENWVIPFFMGFNHMRYLDDRLGASRFYSLAAKRHGNSPVLEHLANLMAAEGGDIYASLVGLRAMLAGEKNETVRKRYEEEIAALEKAVTVIEAVHAFKKERGHLPARLDELVPWYIQAIPDLGPRFVLSWEPPDVKVRRPMKMGR